MQMMSSKLLWAALAGGLALSAANGAFAANTVMDTCSAQYKADKDAGKLATGQTWPQYYSACAAKVKASSGTSTTAAAPAAPAPAATETAAAGGNSTMATCSAQYKLDKAANKVPQGQTWPKYYSACAADLKAEDAATATAPEPTKASAAAPLPTVDKNGKAFTPGQLAFYKRERQCGQLWQADKAAGKTSGTTWPKYLSACNTKLKAAGN